MTGQDGAWRAALGDQDFAVRAREQGEQVDEVRPKLAGFNARVEICFGVFKRLRRPLAWGIQPDQCDEGGFVPPEIGHRSAVAGDRERFIAGSQLVEQRGGVGEELRQIGCRRRWAGDLSR